MKWNSRAAHSLHRRPFHLLPSPHTAIFPLAVILHKQESELISYSIHEQSCQGYAVLARAGHRMNTPIGLDHHRIFPGHSALTIGNEIVSFVHSFVYSIKAFRTYYSQSLETHILSIGSWTCPQGSHHYLGEAGLPTDSHNTSDSQWNYRREEWPALLWEF